MDLQGASGGYGKLGAAQVETLLYKHLKQYLFPVSKGLWMPSNVT